ERRRAVLRVAAGHGAQGVKGCVHRVSAAAAVDVKVDKARNDPAASRVNEHRSGVVAAPRTGRPGEQNTAAVNHDGAVVHDAGRSQQPTAADHRTAGRTECCQVFTHRHSIPSKIRTTCRRLGYPSTTTCKPPSPKKSPAAADATAQPSGTDSPTSCKP